MQETQNATPSLKSAANKGLKATPPHRHTATAIQPAISQDLNSEKMYGKITMQAL
jgi:hypothetical protein